MNEAASTDMAEAFEHPEGGQHHHPHHPQHVAGSATPSDLKPGSETGSTAGHTPPNGITDDGLAEKGAPVPEAEGPVRTVSGFTWIVVVIAILSSTFLFALDNTIVADVQPSIVHTFGEIDKLPWLPVAFLVAALSTNLFWGKIYSQFNAKWLYILTTLFFEGGSAMCGGANSMNTLIGGRVLAGLGGAGMYVGVMTLLSTNTTERERPTYIGFTGLTWGAGTVLGPIIGGAFADSSATWRWAFYINLIIFALCAPVYVFLLPSKDPRPGVPIKNRLAEIDFVGTILVVGAFVSGVMAVSFGGIVYSWNSGQTIGLFVCSAVLFILFAVQQGLSILTTPERRLFPVHFLFSKIMVILFVQCSCAVTAIFVPIYFIPLLFSFTRGDTALDSGVRLLPFICLMVFFVILNGGMMSAFGYYTPWYIWGGALVVIGASLMYTVDEFTSTSRIYGYLVLLGIGAGSYGQASFSVAQAKVPKAEIPLAIGYISLAQIGGATIALAIANSVFLNQATNGILTLLPGTPLAEVQGAIAGTGSSFFNNLKPDVKTQVLGVITAAIGKNYILSIVAGSLTLVLTPFMSFEKLFLAAGAAG